MKPDIYLFNPTCEMAVANGTVSWQPSRMLRNLEVSLDCLPVFFSHSDDIILITDIPSDEYLDILASLGFSGRHFMTQHALTETGNKRSYEFGELKPWGWSPEVHHRLRNLKSNCDTHFINGKMGHWNPLLKNFYSRVFARDLLQKLMEESELECVKNEQAIPVICNSIEDILKLHTKWGKTVIKAPWSASGRGVFFIRKTPVNQSVKQRIRGVINLQTFLMAEPYLDNKLNFANHFFVKNSCIRYLGYSLFKTSENGKYAGNILNGCVSEELNDYYEFLLEINKELVADLRKQLEKSELIHNYDGYLGIDAMVYKNEKQLKIQPCVEINLRYTMGLLAFNLEKLLPGNKGGYFKQFYGKPDDFKLLMEECKKCNPPVIENGKILSGILPLVNIKPEQQFGAYIEVPD